MYENEFAVRLAALRMQKGVSARDMSLSIGQNPGYINSIENGKSLPSMAGFFFICEYLGITPEEFFDGDLAYPQETRSLIRHLNRLERKQFESIALIVAALAEK